MQYTFQTRFVTAIMQDRTKHKPFFADSNYKFFINSFLYYLYFIYNFTLKILLQSQHTDYVNKNNKAIERETII